MTHPISKILILTGAGISKESGLDTFRGPDGVYARVNVEEVATPAAFRRNPGKVHSFYNARRAALLQTTVSPNEAHRALARLESEHPAEVLLVTQNVDDLHERGGSRQVVHMHGELLKARCEACRHVHEWREDIDTTTACPKCNVVGRLRVHVVWFGEVPFHLEMVADWLQQCDLFMAIGTSGTVYPAAGFVRIAREVGARCVELNLESGEGSSVFGERIHGRATEEVPRFVQCLLDDVAKSRART